MSSSKETIQISKHFVATRYVNVAADDRVSTTTYIDHRTKASPDALEESYGLMTVLFETGNPNWKEPDINFHGVPGRFTLTQSLEYLDVVQWALNEARRAQTLTDATPQSVESGVV